MYFPYFRGKQYELITIRETATLLAESEFVPIIEPVKEPLAGLERALDAIVAAGGAAIVVVNPQHGDHVNQDRPISELLNDSFGQQENIIAGIFLSENITLDEVADYLEQYEDRNIALIHAGFADPRSLSTRLAEASGQMHHIFFEASCGRLYRRHFPQGTRVLIRDGFQRRINREHPPIEFFSDLHVTYLDEGMSGFGDFLTVGDDYSETGGPAYAVAIHITFIDDDNDNAMYIHHFVSDRQDTPTDPAGKFAEALDKLVDEVDREGSKIYVTPSIEEFRDLHNRGHFPGLGYTKKLSMKHHIETLAQYFERDE